MLEIQNAYSGKTIVITGGYGFLGRHLAALLVCSNARILVPPRNLDLCNFESTRSYLYYANPDIIIHLAGRVRGIFATTAEPAVSLRDNSLLALSLLEGAKELRHRPLFVAAGSVCAYPQFTSIPFHEENFWNGKPEPSNFAYGEAKRLLLAACEAYFAQHEIRYAYLASANLYGPGDNFNPASSHVIPAIIHKITDALFARAPSIHLHGTGKPTRDFLYAADAAEAYALAPLALNRFDSFLCNTGSGEEHSIAFTASTIARLMGYTGSIEFDLHGPDGQERRRLDIYKAERYLQWRPRTSLETGLSATIDWWRNQ